MRLFINDHYFVSILPKGNVFNCQVMELIHGNGMIPATIDEDQSDVVSSIVDDTFVITNKDCANMEEIFKYHLELIFQL